MSDESQGQVIVSLTPDGKSFSQNTSRPLGSNTIFSSYLDDGSDPQKVFGGDQIIFDHSIGGDLVEIKEFNINSIDNETSIHGGLALFTGAVFDEVSMYAVPIVTPSISGVNTNYQSYGGYLVVPAAGNGDLTIDSEDIVLVQSTIDLDTGVRRPGFWNADYSTSTKLFSNITPAPSGNGEFNIFYTEVILRQFVHKICMLGNNSIPLLSDDASPVGHNMKIVVKVETIGDDHDWKMSAILTLYRKKTA